MFPFLKILFMSMLCSVATDSSDDPKYPPPRETCIIDNTVENECVSCVCAPNNVYQCISKECDIKNNLNETSVNNDGNKKCHPNVVYVHNDTETTCVCDKDGQWPHDRCGNVFGTLMGEAVRQQCDPNEYVIIGCNVCKCNALGEVDNKQCTKNVCNRSSKRRNNDHNNVKGKCEPLMWYSMAPCQFCFCVSKNKLICNTGSSNKQKYDMGFNSLTVCGINYLIDALELVPERGIDLVKTRTVEFTPAVEDESIARVTTSKTTDEKKTTTEDRNDQKNMESSYDELGDKFTKLPPYEDVEDTNEEAAGLQIPMSVYSDLKLSSPLPGNGLRIEHYPIETSTITQSDKETLRMHFPAMIDKLFELALRKSMVKLNSKDKCTPGASFKQNCNVCFCLKNGKTLCTDKICK